MRKLSTRVFEIGQEVTVTLYDGRKVSGKVTAIDDTVRGRLVRVRSGALVLLVREEQVESCTS